MIFPVAVLKRTIDERVPPVERFSPAVSTKVKVPLPVMVPLMVVTAPSFMVSVRPELIVSVLELLTVNLPSDRAPTPKSEALSVVSLEIVRFLTDCELPLRVWALSPFMTSVAPVPVRVPPVRSISPNTVQVPLPIEIDGMPVDIVKLIFPVMLIVGL